jgi:uncharacterized protein
VPVQTVWNVLVGHDPERGIGDYDLIYCDGTDLSWEAEDVVIRRCAVVFADLGAEVEVRNQARVHLWYENHFGVPCAPLRSSADAVDMYAAHACRVAVRRSGGRYEVYAPAGFADLFGFVLRPNPAVAPRAVFETKAARWVTLWPASGCCPGQDPEARQWVPQTGGRGHEFRIRNPCLKLRGTEPIASGRADRPWPDVSGGGPRGGRRRRGRGHRDSRR